MAFNNITSRTDSSALMPEEVSNAMLGKAMENSAVLSLFPRIPVGRAQLRLPVLSALPTAYWVSGDTGLKQTTEVNWKNKFLNVEEIAVIMPVPDNVVADVEQDIWGTAEPLIREQFGRVLDTAVFFGTNAPSSFPTNVTDAATAAALTTTEGSTSAQGGFFGDLDKLYGQVELSGFEVNGFVASTSTKARLRTARDSQGRKLDANRTDGSLSTLDGMPVSYAMRGLWPSTLSTGSNIRMFAGDWSQFVVGVRSDISIKILDQAVIQDNTGAIIYNLAQQDMTAIRVTFRVGWQVANTINNEQAVEANRYPVAVLKY